MSNAQTSLVVKMAITAWQSQNARVDKLIDTLPDDVLKKEIAPGKNTGTYLLGHLAAVNDGLFPLFSIGEKLHPELDDLFLKNPDKAGKEYPSVESLKKYWKAINEKLLSTFNAFSVDDWFGRHTSVSEEDFAKEPHRNKLNVLLNRTSHQSYHLGQLILLTKKDND
jgi:hypothetical protein